MAKSPNHILAQDLGQNRNRLDYGETVFEIRVKPAFTSVNASAGRAELKGQPILSVSGTDAATTREMRIEKIPMNLSSDDVCPHCEFPAVFDYKPTFSLSHRSLSLLSNTTTGYPVQYDSAE